MITHCPFVHFVCLSYESQPPKLWQAVQFAQWSCVWYLVKFSWKCSFLRFDETWSKSCLRVHDNSPVELRTCKIRLFRFWQKLIQIAHYVCGCMAWLALLTIHQWTSTFSRSQVRSSFGNKGQFLWKSVWFVFKGVQPSQPVFSWLGF